MEIKTDFNGPASFAPHSSAGAGAPLSGQAPSVTGWALNVRLLAWSLALAGVVLASLYFWYQHQIRRHADALLERGRTLYDKEEWSAASTSFHQYLRLQPSDENWKEAVLMRARAYDKLTRNYEQKIRATSFYFQALESNPEAHDARLRLAEILYSTGRYREATEQARLVQQAVPDDVKAARVVATALRAQLGNSRGTRGAAHENSGDRNIELDDVVETFKEFLARYPGDIPLSIGLANLLRKNFEVLEIRGRPSPREEADKVIAQMMERHSADVEALVAGFRYFAAYRLPAARQNLYRAKQDSTADEQEKARKALGELTATAGSILAEALALAPDSVDVLSLSSIFESDLADRDDLSAELSQAHRDSARKLAAQLTEAAPDDWRSYATSASLHVRWNEITDAIAVLDSGLKEVPTGARLELNRALLPLYFSTGDTGAAEATLKRLESEFKDRSLLMQADATQAPVRRRLAEEIDMANAQLEMLNGRTAGALSKLKQLAASVTESDNPEETLREQQRRWRMLAAAYAATGQHDMAGAAYDELIRLNPQLIEYRLLAAEQWRNSGDLDRAAGLLEGALEGKGSPAVWLALAQVRLDQQVRKTAVENRDYRSVDAALKTAREQLGDVPAIMLMSATTAIARGDREAVNADLRKLADDSNLDVALLPRLATLQQYAGESALADATLERYRNVQGDISFWALAKSEILRSRGEVPAAIRLLEETLTQVPESARGALLRRLVSLETDFGAIRSVRRRLRELRRAHSPEVWVYETAADLAMMAGDYEDLKECEEEVARVESDGSFSRYLRAVRLLEGDKNKDAQVAAAEANPLCRELEALRPTWAMTRLLRGRIEERLGRIAAAAENYELALRSGSRNLRTFQWLVANLYRQQRYSDAAAYIRQGGQVASLSGSGFSAAAIPENLRRGRIEDAVRLARSAAEFRPDDFLAQLWYGQTLALAEKPSEAEAVFRKAVDLKVGRNDVRTWSALVWFYARQKRLPEARKALGDLVANVTLTDLDRELVLARGSELIGDRGEAERRFGRALAENPKNLKLLEEAGQFYFRFDHDKALELFRQAWTIDPTSVEARRAVALLTGLRGTDADLNSAIAMLDADTGSTELDDRRLQAALLLIRGGSENADKAMNLMKEMIASQEQPRPGDRLLLSRALENAHQIDEAKEQFEEVLQLNETPAFLVLFIEFLLRIERADDAGAALARLEAIDAANARLVELRVEWLIASQRQSEIEETIDRGLEARIEAAKTDAQRAEIFRYAAGLLTRAKLYQAAEKRLRQVMELFPQAYEPLALWLVDLGRLSDALAVCFEKSTGEDRTREATVLVRVLTVAAARSISASLDVAAAETAIADAIKANADRLPAAERPSDEKPSPADQQSAVLLLEAGVLRLMQGHNDESLALYEKALIIEPENAVVLNNRAVVLAELPGRAEDAIRDIDRAIAKVPNSVELLDSKALVLIGIGRFDESREILERLCQSNRKNARYRLHLAFALHCLSEDQSAGEQLNQARKDGLEREILTPTERRYVQEIARGGSAAEARRDLRQPDK